MSAPSYEDLDALEATVALDGAMARYAATDAKRFA